MNGRHDQIGFSQRVRLEWFEQTANLVLAGCSRSEINEALLETLNDKVSIGGVAERGNREKVISILMTCWVTVPTGLDALSSDGLSLLKRLEKRERLAVHWGMSMAAYPFWGSVATQVGRLLRLQGSAAAAQIQRRIREQYGERETAARACRRVLRSYLDWEVIAGAESSGVYREGLTVAIDDIELIAWIVGACLHAHPNGTASLKSLINSPGLFPFRIKHVSGEMLLNASRMLAVVRHGLDEDIVSLIATPKADPR